MYFGLGPQHSNQSGDVAEYKDISAVFVLRCETIFIIFIRGGVEKQDKARSTGPARTPPIGAVVPVWLSSY